MPLIKFVVTARKLNKSAISSSWDVVPKEKIAIFNVRLKNKIHEC